LELLKIGPKEQRTAKYLAQATEADTKAARCKDPWARASWLRIAECLRELAGWT
jgi:hypothetical protein